MMNNFKYIFILLFFFSLFSCDFGVEDGDDLVGKWVKNKYSEFIAFKDDRTGYTESLNKYTGDFNNTDFEWDVKYGDYYKIVEAGEFDYEYYFTDNKSYLYLRRKGDCFFETWSKYRDY